MKHFRGIWLNLLVALVMCGAAFATVPQISGFTTQQDGNTVTAALWNSQIGSVYTYINTNLVSLWNLYQSKGDTLTYDGTNIQRLAVGSNGKVLTADSTQPYGLAWESVANTTALTTTGDLLTYGSGALQRLPVGSDGQVLTARSSASNGVDWENGGVPSGCILLWSGSIASIPSGWHLCDGTSGTPNLQGLFVVGAGNTSPAASGGMGLLAPGGPSGDTSAGAGLGPAHAHSVGVTGADAGPGYYSAPTGATSAATVTPRYYALCYIQKS